MTHYGLSLHFTYKCAEEQCHKGTNLFPIASLSFFFLNILSNEDADILLESSLTFKLRSEENKHVERLVLTEVRLVLKMTIWNEM